MSDRMAKHLATGKAQYLVTKHEIYRQYLSQSPSLLALLSYDWCLNNTAGINKATQMTHWHDTVKILKFGTPQTIAIIVLKIEKFDVTLH